MSNTIVAKFSRRISKPNDDYCIYLCSSTDWENLHSSIKHNGQKAYVTIKGMNLPQLESCKIEYTGNWVQNSKYGIQFAADTYRIIPPDTKKGMISFLSSRAFRGIGKATATNIVNEFGLETFNIIEKEPNKLLRCKGCTPEKIGLIVTSYNRNQSFSQLSTFLGTYGISHDTAIKINETYGTDALEKIKKNPYIIREFRGVGFKTCDKIARNLNVALNSFERIKNGVLEVLFMHVERTKDTFMYYENMYKSVMKLLNEGLTEDAVTEDDMKKTLVKMRNENFITFVGGKAVYLYSYARAEDYSTKKLADLLQNSIKMSKDKINKTIEEIDSQAKFRLAKGQRQAVEKALSNRVMIITGSAGTGKSTVLSSIVKCYEKLYPHHAITLLAPTGKAASRMTECTGKDASTIHSKLHVFDSSSLSVQPLEEGLVVIDEVSMVDSLLFDKLMRAITSRNYQVVFLGDTDQLPSVSAGAVLRDMIASKTIPTHRLTEIFRQKNGSTIVTNGNLINSGDINIIYDNDFELVEATTDNDALEIIKTLYQAEVKKYGIENVMLLSPLRQTQGRFKCVSDSLNSVLQNIVNPLNEQLPSCKISGKEYRLGDRVLQWKNNEQTSNGDIGEIKCIENIDDELTITIVWENGVTTKETRETMGEISLAYSISIHKSQGSEAKSVIIPLLEEHKCALFRRNLLYTGISRAKQHVILVSSKKTVDFCIQNEDSSYRNTLFAERLEHEIGF